MPHVIGTLIIVQRRSGCYRAHKNGQTQESCAAVMPATTVELIVVPQVLSSDLPAGETAHHHSVNTGATITFWPNMY
ncbi:hypothetical protein ACLBR5_03300 [Escherichia coli]